MLKLRTGDKNYHLNQTNKTKHFLVFQSLLLIFASLFLIIIPGSVNLTLVFSFYTIMVLSLVFGMYCLKKHYTILKMNI